MSKKVTFITGLRAIAVILIIIDHFVFKKNLYNHQTFPYTFFRDGMNGIFLLFITESYAITRSIMSLKKNYGKFSIFKFYLKRLIWVLPVLYAYVSILYFSGMYEGHFTKDSFISALTLSFNYLGKPHTDAVMHYWAFCAKESFIILFSPFIIYLSKNKAKIFFWCLAVISILIRAITYYSFENPHAFDWWTYMQTHLHLFAFSFGVLVALTRDEKLDDWFHKFKIHWLALIFLIGLSPYWESTEGVVYSWLYKPIVSSLCFGILVKYFSVNPNTVMPKVLRSRPLLMIGAIYYSLYVWQQLYTFGTLRPDFGLKEVVTYTIYSFGLGIAAFWIIEKPLKYLSLKITYK